MNELIKVLEREVYLDENTNPAIVVLKRKTPPKELIKIGFKALFSVVSLKEVKEALIRNRIEYYALGNERGLIGAASAIGNILADGRDHTYELLAYRAPINFGKPRKICVQDVFRVSRTYKTTFANVDYEAKRVLITPRGPDPVLMGIRGDDPRDLYLAFKEIRVGEKVDSWVIYVTNQGTDAHLTNEVKIESIKPYHQVIFRGRLAENPKALPGGHVYLLLRNETSTIKAMVYSEGGEMCKKVLQLRVGDEVKVYGGVKPKGSELIVNVQKLEILKLTPVKIDATPVCPRCGLRMKSLGFKKGYFCKCGYHLEHYVSIETYFDRKISPIILLPPLRSIRHLTKPIKRYGKENFRKSIGVSFKPWCSFLEEKN